MSNHIETMTDALREARAALLNPHLDEPSRGAVVRTLEGAITLAQGFAEDNHGCCNCVLCVLRERVEDLESCVDAASVERYRLAVGREAQLVEALGLAEEALAIHAIEDRLRDQQAGVEHVPDDGDALVLKKAREALERARPSAAL